MLWDVLDDTSRGMTGEYGQLNVLDNKLNKYVLALPVETLPSVVGSTNTVENDVTTSRVIGKIEGKQTIDDKEITFLWCRDNVARLNELVGKQLAFLVSYKDGTGWKFSGKIKYKPDDGTSSEKLTGTFTIIANDVDSEATMNVLDEMAKTCIITNGDLPSEIHIDLSSATKTYELPLKFSNSSATCEAKSDNSGITATITDKKLTITVTGTTATNGIVTLTPKAEGEASWVNHILVVAE